MNDDASQSSRFWASFGFGGLDAEEFKKRTTAVQLALFTAVAGAGYSVVYALLGFPKVPYVTALYITICLSNVLYLRISHRYNVFGVVQLGLILLFPLGAQLAIGGFVESSGVGLAIFLAPAGALLYASRRVARICFYLFGVELIGAALWEYYYGRIEPTLPRAVILTFFCFVFISTCSVVYFLLESFLQKQKELRAELRQSLDTLQATQEQLIQAEKMASLGELTAGIAHEIQNPLNFVNNFSETGVELLDELKEELAAGHSDDVALLIDDLSQNLQRITQHGQRASTIVKSMLEHFRSSSGEKFPTDLNALADEYLNLAYHGMRAKNRNFNTALETNFSPELGLVNVVPQDIGRVILNMVNNAFYAVQEKLKHQPDNYQPRVSISTVRTGDQVEIHVRDNGTGIPASVKQKIFQPFFTTKPTGEGTGLGLSLSYDIVVNGHRGTFLVDTEPGQFTEFIVCLPIT